MRAGSAIAVVAIVAAVLGWRTRAAAARLPTPPDLHGGSPRLAAQVEAADRLARRWPERSDIVGELAMTYHADLLYDEALTAYSLAERLDPADWRWPYYRAVLHMERGLLAPAAEALDAVVKLRPQLALAWWRLGETEFKRASYQDAEHAYARAESAGDPTVAIYAKAGRARALFSRGERQAAIALLTELLQATPRFGPAHRVLADVYRADGRDTEADRHSVLGSALRAYAAPPDPSIDRLAEISRSSVFLLRVAASLDLTREAARREQLVRRALESDERNPDVVYEMGALLQQLRRPDQALPYFSRYSTMVPNDQQTLVQIAKCEMDLGHYDRAEASLRQALAIGDDAVGFYNLGIVLERRGQTGDAEESYRRAVVLGPGLAGARNNLGVLVAARGGLDEAARLMLESIRLDPTDANAYTNLSAVRLQQNQPADAKRYAELAIELDPQLADGHANLGVALAQSGDFEGARRALEAALKLDPSHPNALTNLTALNQR